MIREAGKPWREADADTCEAIDFCEYYARESVRLFQPERLGLFVGELNHQWYQPRGVASVISPWNFPLAICCGMTVAALSVGNTAVGEALDADPRRRPGDVRNPLAGRRAQATCSTSCPAPGSQSATCWSATRAWP